MTTSDGDIVVVLFVAIAVAVVLLRRWARPYLDEAIAIRSSQTNGEPYEPPPDDHDGAGASQRMHRRLARHGRMTLALTLALLPLAVLADPRTWLRDVMSDCAEADSAVPRVLLVVSHLCSAPNRISVVWSGRCRRLLRLLPR